MFLYLVRHGKAESSGEDFGRRLTEQGREAVRRVASRLAEANIHVDRIEHSGLVRAAETAEAMSAAVGGEVLAVDDLGAMADVVPVAERVSQSGVESLMLVGHEPFMGKLASYLVAGNKNEGAVHFRAGAAACLSDEEGSWRLEWLLPPDLA